MKNPIVFLVDIDGTLTNDTAWTVDDVLKCKPNKRIVDKINKLYETKFIVIWTARRDHLIPKTLEWLRRNNIMYHAISNLKCSADKYVDDKAIRPEEL